MARSKNKRQQVTQSVAQLASQGVAVASNHTIYYDKYRQLINKLIMNRIEWVGLPDTVDPRWLEVTLAQYGNAIFYDGTSTSAGKEEAFVRASKEDAIFLVSKVVQQGSPDVYGNFNDYRAIGFNFNYQIPHGEGVVIWNSTTRENSWMIMNSFAQDLAEIDSIAKLNRKQQRFAKIIAADESAINDAERVLKKVDQGEPVIMGLKSLTDKVTAATLDLSVPYLQADFHKDRESLMAELFTYLGIKNVGREKSTYMNYSETDLSNDAIARVREDLLSPRKQAAEEINRKWGLNVDVRWKEEEVTKQDSGQTENIEEGQADEQATEGA